VFIENVKHGKYSLELQPGHSIYRQSRPPQIADMVKSATLRCSSAMNRPFPGKPFLIAVNCHKHESGQAVFPAGSV